MPEIEAMAEEVVKYLDSEEASAVLHDLRPDHNYIHPDKLPYDVRRVLDHLDHWDHPSEFLHRVFYDREPDGFYRVESSFAAYYMTLLARRIADSIGAGLLTDRPHPDSLARAARLDAYIPISFSNTWPYRHEPFHHRRYHQRISPKRLAAGCLASVIMEAVDIDPETPVLDILRFRDTHADELARFRLDIDRLAKSLEDDLPYEALVQSVRDIVLNEVMPSYNDLKNRLREHSINWLATGFLKVTAISTGATAIPTALLGLSVPIALIAGFGISVATSSVMFCTEREEILRDNPYSYLLALEKLAD